MPASGLINLSVAGGLVNLNLDPSTNAGFSSETRFEDYVPALLNARVAGHGVAPHSAPNRMVQASNNVYVKNFRVCRVGDLCDCGHPIANGASTVFVN